MRLKRTVIKWFAMVEKTFSVANMTCSSCEELVRRAVNSFPGASLKKADTANGTVTIECAEPDFDAIREAVYEQGYAPAVVVNDGFNAFVAGLFGGNSSFQQERELLEYSAGAFILSIFAAGLIMLNSFSSTDGFFSFGLPFAFLLAASVTAAVGAFFHVISFRKLSCMTGMMVGMTIGMISGFLLGAIVGSTNGLFFGSLAGMIPGMALGASAGKSGGVMGVMEGIMAGLMSGTMGAMMSVMLLGDYLMPFLFILLAVSIVILGGLSYAVLKDAGRVSELKTSFPVMALIVLASTIILSLLMVYGPKAGVFLKVFA